MKNVQREVKYPENKKISMKLKRGERIVIAEYAGLRPSTIRDMLNGYRRITFSAGQAIIRFFEEREKVSRTLDEITNL